MAVVLLVLAVIGGGVVADLVLENTAGGEVSVLHQPVSGHSQGALLALAAGLGLVVGLLLVASMGSTRTRRARRKQLRRSRPGRPQHLAEPDGQHADRPDELFGRQQSGGELGEPARPADLGRGGRWAEQPDGRAVAPEPAGRHPQARHGQTRRAVHRGDDPDPWFGPAASA